MTLESSSACNHLRSCGLRAQEAYPILNEVQKWVHRNGPEWTVQRLKTLKQGYVNKLAYGNYQLPKDSWIKHGRNGPRGPFRILMKLRKPQKALSAFMVYTSFIAKRVLPSQEEKFYSSLEPGKELPPMKKLSARFGSSKDFKWCSGSSFASVSSLLQRSTRIPVYTPDPDDWYSWTLSTAPMSMEGIGSSAAHPLIERWIEDRSYNGDHIPDDIYAVYTTAVMDGDMDLDVDYVGVISHIQEPGLKLRAVANPLPIFQLALSSFGRDLYETLGGIPEDSTFDQDKAISDIQEYMLSGGKLAALDLSDATNRFPLDYTLEVLRDRGLNEADLDLFKSVSRGTWKDKHMGDVQWKHGQPLGLYPSFAAFALSHHSLVRDVIPKGTFYRILGDDIVVDARYYRDVLTAYRELGLKISLEKSLNSPVLTEFAGRLISKDRVLIQPKWKDVSDNSFMEYARQMGPTCLGLLKPRQKRLVKLFSEVPRTAHPFGMGWNPHGKTYDQRMEESRELLSLIEEKISDYSSPTSKPVRDLRVAIYTNSSEFAIDITPKNKDLPLADMSDACLRFAGVTHASFTDDTKLPGWIASYITSDPRGAPLLTSLERRYSTVLKNQQDSEESSSRKGCRP